ncbi:MAG: histidine phosphatase family protein [Polyangiaceae bacterium]|nr:histidine phosphatase family protein [Polyangiaceae bacterium]
MRHAKSSWRDVDLDDHDRVLNRRGRHAAPEMGKLLRKEKLVPDCIISSTAKRAVETAELVHAAMRANCDIELRRRLYLAEPETVYDVLNELPSETKCVLVIGHNPGLAELVEQASGSSVEMVTAAVAHLKYSIKEFSKIDQHSPCKLTAFYRPTKKNKSA